MSRRSLLPMIAAAAALGAAYAAACSSATFSSTGDAGSAEAGVSDGSSSADVGADADDRGDAAPSDGGAPSEGGGTIECFGVHCNVGAQTCCFGPSSDAGICATRPDTCTTPSALACDDPTDCPDGAPCCITWDATKTRFNAQCSASCYTGPQSAFACDRSALVDQCPTPFTCQTRADFYAPLYLCQ